MQSRNNKSYELRNELKPGDIGHLVWLHGTLYDHEYNFDRILSMFIK